MRGDCIACDALLYYYVFFFFQISHFYSPLFCDRSVSVQPSGVGVSIAFEKIVSAMLEQEDVSIFDEMENSSRGLFVQFDGFSFPFFFFFFFANKALNC